MMPHGKGESLDSPARVRHNLRSPSPPLECANNPNGDKAHAQADRDSHHVGHHVAEPRLTPGREGLQTLDQDAEAQEHGCHMPGAPSWVAQHGPEEGKPRISKYVQQLHRGRCAPQPAGHVGIPDNSPIQPLDTTHRDKCTERQKRCAENEQRNATPFQHKLHGFRAHRPSTYRRVPKHNQHSCKKDVSDSSCTSAVGNLIGLAV